MIYHKTVIYEGDLELATVHHDYVLYDTNQAIFTFVSNHVHVQFELRYLVSTIKD